MTTGYSERARKALQKVTDAHLTVIGVLASLEPQDIGQAFENNGYAHGESTPFTAFFVGADDSGRVSYDCQWRNADGSVVGSQALVWYDTVRNCFLART